MYEKLTVPLPHVAFHPAAALGLESLNALFYFSAFIYMAVFIGRLLFCRGTVCAPARAAAVFGAFEFALFCATAALAARAIAANGGGFGFAMPSLGRRAGKPAPVEKDAAAPAAMEEGGASRA